MLFKRSQIIILVLITLLSFTFLSCKKLKQAKDLFVKKGVEFLKKSHSKDIECPDNMVNIDNICMDIYEYPNDVGYYPLVNKTWFQAQADCGRRGKRLCTSSEWVKACSGVDNYRYPYGNSYESGMCRTESKKVAMVATHMSCKSYYGVYDMVGNVWEWTTYEEDTAVARAYGGHWTFGEAAKCSIYTTLTKTHSSNNIGFRCCK
ncbi:formylglycine-generating enzyme family protein [bacterium]|nr:formylglycine-generating enzyme family protein [bacterium]